MHSRRGPSYGILLAASFALVTGCSKADSPTTPAALSAPGTTAVSAGTPGVSGGTTASTPGADLNHQLAEVRAATARYHNIDNAIADGFAPVSPCVESPAGGMGFHYGNQSRINDPAINHLEPEVLLYAPDNGRLRLVAVEWIVPAPIWPGGTANPPSLFGLDFHAGPPPLLVLHAWIWHNNPNGIFQDFNPRVSCSN